MEVDAEGTGDWGFAILKKKDYDREAVAPQSPGLTRPARTPTATAGGSVRCH